MKKNLVYLIVFLVLLALAGWLFTESSGSSTLTGPENYAFAVKDTADIQKIIISDKSPKKVEISRDGSRWLLNGEYPVRNDAIEILLETLYRMEMRNFLPQRLIPEVEKQLSALGKRVEIYQNGELAKVLYVGLPTSDEVGTYMKVEGGDAPYAVHIPGFNGFLNTRFIVDDHLWRSRELMRINPRNIKELSVLFPDSLDQSFTINVFSPDSLYIQRASDNKVIKDASQIKARLVLSAMKKLSYEGEIVATDPIYSRRDSLLSAVPVFKVSVKDIDGKVQSFSGYKIKAAPETIDFDDPKTFYDPDRLHGFINDERMILLQYYALRNIIKPLAYYSIEDKS